MSKFELVPRGGRLVLKKKLKPRALSGARSLTLSDVSRIGIKLYAICLAPRPENGRETEGAASGGGERYVASDPTPKHQPGDEEGQERWASLTEHVYTVSSCSTRGGPESWEE